MDIGEVSRQLAQRAESIAAMLLPGGKKQGQEWRAGDIHGSTGDSLGIHLTGEKAGIWKDFSTSQSGDLIDLWATVKGISLVEAYGEAKRFLGISDPVFHSRTEKKSYRLPETAAPGTRKLSELSPVFTYLTEDRKLSLEVLGVYRIAEREDERHGWQIVFPYKRNKKLVNVKYLDLLRTAEGKKVMTVETGCELCLFGWQVVPDNARAVIISEGEIDALTWYQMGHIALSVPNGCTSEKWIETEYENLERFETIYLSFDEDKGGQAAIPKLIERLGRHRVKVIHLPHKDANECLQKGVTKEEFDRAVMGAETADPVELKNALVYLADVIEEFYPKNSIEPGFITPFPKLGGDVRFRPGESSLWTGINGHGKSMLLSQIVLSGAEQGHRFCVAPTEMQPRKWLKRQVIQATLLAHPPVETIKSFHYWASEWMWLFNVSGKDKPKRALDVFEYAWRRYDITDFVVDSLVKMGFALDDYNGQKDFVELCTDFARDTNTHFHLVAHARKGKSEKEIVGKMDVKGTGAITDLMDNLFTVWRNKNKEEIVNRAEAEDRAVSDYKIYEQPDAMLICDKQRNGDWEKRLSLWYDKETMQYRDDMNGPSYRFVKAIAGDAVGDFDGVDLGEWTQ